VLVVGAGFTGFHCARALAKQHDCAVTLVNPEDYSLYTPLLPDVAGGLLDPRHIAVPLAQTLPGVRVVRGMVDSVDLAARTATVHLAGRDGDVEAFGWDRLVIAAGSVTKLFDIPGLATRARGLKTLAEALYLRDHLLGELETSVTEPDPTAGEACRTVVVVGASYAGTELVAQLRGLADTAARHHDFPTDSVRFLLLDLAEQVMPEVGQELGNNALDVLRRRGVDVRLGTTLTRVDDEAVTLSDGTAVPTRTVAWVTGVTASPLVAALGLPLTGGRLQVTAQLSVPGHPHVFAGGDAAGVPDLTRPGSITPPTAQHAVRQGRALARNVAASLGHGHARAYRHHNLGLVVDLGPGFAVANPLGLRLSGLPAKALTRGYHLAAMPRTANRAQIAADYVTGLDDARPVVALGLIDPARARFRESEHQPAG
jgi:NADH dehydrogenase